MPLPYCQGPLMRADTLVNFYPAVQILEMSQKKKSNLNEINSTELC